MAAGEETPGTQVHSVVFFGNDAGTEYEIVRPGNPLPVTATITPSGTQDVNIEQVGGTTVTTGAGATSAGSQRVTVAQDVTTIAGSAPGIAGTPSTNVVTVQGVTGGTSLPTSNTDGIGTDITHSFSGVGADSFSGGMDGYDCANILIRGTYAGFTITFSESPDGGTTYVPAKGVLLLPNGLSIVAQGTYTLTANQTALIHCNNLNGSDNFKVSTTAGPATGTAVVDVSFTGFPSSEGATVIAQTADAVGALITSTLVGAKQSLDVNSGIDAVMDNATASGSVSSAATFSFTNSTTPRGPFSAAGVTNIDTTGYGSGSFQVIANASANTITPELSDDGGTTWSPIALRNIGVTSGTGAALNTAATSGLYQINGLNGLLRVRVSTFIGGTSTVAIALKRNVPPNVVDAFVGNAVTVVGSVASGSADSGNPVKVGGRYNTTLPTFTDGQRGDNQLNVKGSVRVVYTDDNGQTATVNNNASSGQANSNGIVTNSRSYLANGTNWDQSRTITGVDGTGLGVLAVEEGGASFNNITTATTTTVKSGAGTFHKLILNTVAASATITMYNNTTATGTKIGTITNPVSLLEMGPLEATYDIYFSTGLTIVTTGVQDITVVYR